MPQLFPRSANTFSKFSIVLGFLLVVGSLFLIAFLDRSPYVTLVGVAREQPIPFSHKHHVGGLGIDCRYCHTSVETSSFAGIPPTETCMNCHSILFSESDMLEPVRKSFRTGEPLQWNRVNDVPDYVYFDHSIHIAKGISCTTCHGRVDQMPLMMKARTFHMGFCIDCHREPERFVRPREHVFDPAWEPSEDQMTMGRRLVKAYGIKREFDCNICHR